MGYLFEMSEMNDNLAIWRLEENREMDSTYITIINHSFSKGPT
jgi:hypothetical protein